MGNFSNYWDLHTLFTKIKNKIKSVSDSIPTKLSDLTDDTTHRTVTDTEKSTWNGKSNFSGSYNDLTNKPTIPAAQVNSDWNATTGVAKINNKPTLATVATSGSYNDLSNKPTIPTKTSELTNNSNFVADSSYVHTDNNYTTAEKTKLSGIASGAEANVQSDWNQTTTTADDFIKNKPSSMPASDVYAWAKASTKPSYNFGEIGSGVAIIGNGEANHGIKWRTADTWHSGVYYHRNYDESVVFANQNTRASWMFAYTDIDNYTSWASLTPSMQIKNGKVTINKLIPSGEQASYNLDVNGTANATTIYENGTALSSKYAANTPTFTEASTRANIASGETMPKILGKIKKFFTDLKTVAFSGSYSDLTNKPTSMPASDVYAWAKASAKPTYTASEVNAAPAADVPFKFGVDSSGNYGYIKAGADTVTPFKTVGTRSSNITANGTYTASSDISKDGYSSVTVAVPNSVQTKTVTPGTSQMYVTPDAGYIGLSQVTINVANNQYKTVSPTVAAQIVRPDTGYWLSGVTVDGIPTQEKTVTPSTSAQTVTPDSGKYLTSVSVGAISTQEKTVTSSRSAQTVTPDSGKYLSKVTVNALAPTGTYTASSRSASLDMGATSNYRYVNTNSVPNSNSSKLTLSYSSSANYGNYDMGATNTNRYLDILDVTDHYYDVGQNDGYDEGYDDRAPVTLWTNPSPANSNGFSATTITISNLKRYAYIFIIGRLLPHMSGYHSILGGFEPNNLGTTWPISDSKYGLSNANFAMLGYGTVARLRFGYFNGSNQITIGNGVNLDASDGSGSVHSIGNGFFIPEKIIGIL